MLTGNARMNGLLSRIPALTNLFFSAPGTSHLIKAVTGVSQQRNLPQIHRPLENWYQKNIETIRPRNPISTVYFFNDEFTRYLDTEIGKTAISLLSALGYEVRLMDHEESGRAHFSKGLLKEAKRMATDNVRKLSNQVTDSSPLIGIEPSAILSFRDEYPDIVDQQHREEAIALGKNALLFDEFLYREMMAGRITSDRFDEQQREIKLHGHCHQKALTDISQAAHILSLPKGHSVELIPSGCCGMAGSFGYEKEHYDVSMKIGEDVLFPAIRNASAHVLIAAPGTSCRHQIKDGTGRNALHPVEVLFEALRK